MNTALAVILALSAAGPRTVWRDAAASWYHEDAVTATGEPFDADGLTFAMRSRRFGHRRWFRNPRTGRVVEARHNDFGPARWTQREFDLSRGTARALGLLGPGEPGTLRVQVGEWRVMP